MPLPGEKSQYKMAPFERPIKEEAMKQSSKPKLSAVLCLFYPKSNQVSFALILRNSYKGTHSAQVSFPGGKKEETDESMMHTALRETEEEIGVPAKNINIIGELSEIYIPPSGFLVSPYVGFVSTNPKFIPDKIEVNSIIETPLQLFMNEGIVKKKSITLSLLRLGVGMKLLNLVKLVNLTGPIRYTTNLILF